MATPVPVGGGAWRVLRVWTCLQANPGGVILRHGGKKVGAECVGSARAPRVGPGQVVSSLHRAVDPSVGARGSHVGGAGSVAGSRLMGSQCPDPVGELRRRLVCCPSATMDHIPSGARASCSSRVAGLLTAVSGEGSSESWVNLLAFAPAVLAKPVRGGKGHNITKLVKTRVTNYTDYSSWTLSHEHAMGGRLAVGVGRGTQSRAWRPWCLPKLNRGI